MPQTANRIQDPVAQVFFNTKTLKPSFSHWDFDAQDHAYAFTVAKMMNTDLLADTKRIMDDCIKKGLGFNIFKQTLEKRLAQRGWWRDKDESAEETARYKSHYRLRRIFETNIRTAYAQADWQRRQRNKRLLPYLEYMPSRSIHKRADHAQFVGIVAHIDDPIWQHILPPNGWGCKCWVRSLSKREAEGRITDTSNLLKFTETVNPRTGAVYKHPIGVDWHFDYPPAKHLDAIAAYASEKISKTELLRGMTKAGLDKGAAIDYHLAFGKRVHDLFNPDFARVSPSEFIDEVFASYLSKGQPAFEVSLVHPLLFNKLKTEHPNLERSLPNKASLRKIDLAFRAYPPSLLTGIKELEVVALPAGTRSTAGTYTLNSAKHYFLAMADDAPFSSFVHEVGHLVEYSNEEIFKLFKAYFERRTEGQTVIDLHTKNKGYKVGEEAIPDGFPLDYFGKVEKGEPREMVSMSYQYLLGGNKEQFLELYSEDRDLFYFALSILINFGEMRHD